MLAGKGVPIMLLNACQSGMTHPEALYPSIGNQLLVAGVRGVVAMTYAVYVQTAVRFMARLYEALMRGEELARAVAVAREDLRAQPHRSSPIGDVPLRDWVVPALFEAAPVRATTTPLGALRLDPTLLKDQQAAAGTEIDCPDPPDYGFVGRDDVILALERAFQTETVVLLDGMAGAGKTQAAIGFARWRAETGALGGPVFFFHFGQYLPLAQVCDRVGQVFQQVIKDQLDQEWHLLDAEPRRRLALSIMRQVPCLMIWDNVEPVAGFPVGTPSAWTVEEQRDLRDFLQDLRGGQTKILLTSRRDEPWLGNLYHRLEVGGLTRAEGQELALRVLRRAGLSAQQIYALPPYDDLLRYLDGNPLAIQVIVPELQHKPPDALLRDLQAGQVSLRADDPAHGREHSLTASLTYRLDALDPIIHQRLGVLGFFQGVVSADVLAAMCAVDDTPDGLHGLGREDWVRMLDTAAAMGLLRRVGDGYYTIHPALPWFFQDLLRSAFPDHRASLERAFSAVYASYGLHLFGMVNTNTEMAMRVLRAEEGNLLNARRLARRHERWSEIGGILAGLSRLLTRHGRWVEWERHIADLEAEVTGGGQEPISGREDLWTALLGHRSQIAHYRRDFAHEETIHLRLKDHFARRGDDRSHVVALQQLGSIALERRQFDEAERWYRQSLAITERLGDAHGQAITLHQLGIIAEARRQFDEAEGYYRQSLAITERLGNAHGQAQTLHQLGSIALERRQFDEAEGYYRQSLAIEERLGDALGQAISLHHLGIIAQQRQQFDEAERWYRQSLAIAGRLGNEHGQAGTLYQLGRIAQQRQQSDEAERWYRQSLAIEERLGDAHGQAMALHQLGMIAQGRRQFDEAEGYYRQSLAIEERLGNPHGQATTLHQLGRIAEECGDAAEAVRFYDRAEVLLVHLNDPDALEVVRASRQRVHRSAHDNNEP